MAKRTAKSVINTLVIALVVGIAAYNTLQENSPSGAAPSSAGQAVTEAFNNRQSDIQLRGAGVVVKVLRDDTSGSRHQKMLLEMPSGQTILIAHNIDLAPRIKGLREGDTVEFYGEYEYTAKGGVVHWTHRDPGGRHEHGWLKHNGKTYQ
jgi:hypothetical protein